MCTLSYNITMIHILKCVYYTFTILKHTNNHSIYKDINDENQISIWNVQSNIFYVVWVLQLNNCTGSKSIVYNKDIMSGCQAVEHWWSLWLVWPHCTEACQTHSRATYKGPHEVSPHTWTRHRGVSECLFEPLFFLCSPPSLPPAVCLDHALHNSLHDVRQEREKNRRKVGQGDLFSSPQFTEAEGGGVIVS